MKHRTIVCSKCRIGPLSGRALYKDKGALFHSGKSIKAVGPLFCAACAPSKIKRAIVASTRCDAATVALAVA
jgi:hypothetical protein